MVRVEVKELTKNFGRVVAVDKVSFEVKNKEFLVLLGPSGCGKTTTLRCIAGLENPDEGEIYIGDKLVNELPPKERDIAMVFQSYALYPHMTVFDNLAFPLKMRKIPKGEINKRVMNAANLLQIKDLLDRKPRQLSGGEAQRVALGRAIVRNPSVFLMDEPLSNLDAKLRVYMRAELKKLQKDLEVTTIYVTHDQVEAMTMSDTIAIMNKGRLQQIGSAEEIFHKPSNIFVAGFIGSPPMNFIECNFVEKDGSCFLEASNFTIPFPNNIGEIIKKQATSSELLIGVRPENVCIKEEKTPSTFIESKVYVIEPLGSETIVDFKVGDQMIKARVAPDFPILMDKRMWIGFKIEEINIFDKKTEKAII